MISFKIMSGSDVPGLRRLWGAVFDEKTEAVDLFFERNIDNCRGYFAELEGKPVSALYLLDCSLNGKRAHYLCGAATLPDFRGRGIMSRLIGFALDDAVKRGDLFSLLFPAGDSLYGYYRRFGYERKCFRKRIKICGEGGDLALSAAFPDAEELQRLCFKKNFLLWNNNFVRFACDYYSLYGAKALWSGNALAILLGDEIIYSAYNDIKELKKLLPAGEYLMTVKTDDPLFPGAPETEAGMLKPLGGDGLPDKVFLGLTLE